MTKEEVLSKVRKLFELSHSPNENEAALAAAKARELLSRHNLTIADLPTDEITKEITATQTTIWVGSVIRNWVKGLLIHVANGFDCQYVVRRRNGKDPLLTFIGTGADTEVGAYVFQFLYRELNRLVDKALPKLKRENRGWSASQLRYAYLDGAVKRIGERFQEQTRTVREAERAGCKDLIVAKDQAIRKYMEREFTNIKVEYGKRRLVSASAFQKGYLDADTINLRPGVGVTDSDQLAVTS
ncbi:MAG: DUF2786 domain-containing protein [Desulfomonile sp.]|nr:DUF2786 domain-containing protein [Desulfomonile sp.]